jgi:hypothetical protein
MTKGALEQHQYGKGDRSQEDVPGDAKREQGSDTQMSRSTGIDGSLPLIAVMISTLFSIVFTIPLARTAASQASPYRAVPGATLSTWGTSRWNVTDAAPKDSPKDEAL